MRFPPWLTVYGDQSYRGPCNKEWVEQKACFGILKENYPWLYRLAVHPKNEGQRSGKEAAFAKMMGELNRGASDIIIPGSPSIVIEIKRKDHTKSSWQDGQLEYLESAHNAGCITCVVLCADGFRLALAEITKARS